MNVDRNRGKEDWKIGEGKMMWEIELSGSLSLEWPILNNWEKVKEKKKIVNLCE